MTDDSPNGPARVPSRRDFLGTATAVGAVATAGCLGSILDTSGSNGDEIDPEEPSEPRKGTPGEFYTLVERNDIPVESLRWDDGDLVLEYSSNASMESESTQEIEIITTVYNENLVKNDAGVGMLYAEVTDPFEGQAHGWGVKTEWCERYNEVVADSEGGNDDATENDGSDDDTGGTSDNETEHDGDDGSASSGEEADGDGAENGSTEASAADQAAVILMSNVLNTRVYAEDLED